MLKEYIKKIIKEESDVKKEMEEIVKALVVDAVNVCFREDYGSPYFSRNELDGHVDRNIERAFGEKLSKTAEHRVNEVIADESFIDHFVEKINKKQLRSVQ